MISSAWTTWPTVAALAAPLARECEFKLWTPETDCAILVGSIVAYSRGRVVTKYLTFRELKLLGCVHSCHEELVQATLALSSSITDGPSFNKKTIRNVA